MAIPFDRKIVYSTYIIPEVLYEENLEEGQAVSYGTIADVTGGGIGKALGGKSRSGEIQIDHNQDYDHWTSLQKQGAWEDITWSHWDEFSFWDGSTATVDHNGWTPYNPAGVTAINYIWIKNTGDTNSAMLSLEGTSMADCLIHIEPFNAFNCRVNGIDPANIHIRAVGGGNTTTIEYIMAQ